MKADKSLGITFLRCIGEKQNRKKVCVCESASIFRYETQPSFGENLEPFPDLDVVITLPLSFQFLVNFVQGELEPNQMRFLFLVGQLGFVGFCSSLCGEFS